MLLSLKTRFLNFLRRAFANPTAEKFLLPLVNGKPPTNLFSKLIPMPGLYPKPSWRDVKRNGLILKLDISDLVDWHTYYAFDDRSYRFLFDQVNPSDVVLDIGANIGFVGLRCAQLATKGSVIGFEPSLYNYTKCQKNLNLNKLGNIVVYNVGMGQKKGSLRLATIDDNNRGMNKIKMNNDLKNHSEELIQVSTIDNWVDENSINHVSLIKIDVEGFELEVLKGAQETLSKFSPRLFLEVNDSYLKGFGSSAKALIEWLKARNYKLFNVSGQPIEDEKLLHNNHTDLFAIIS